MRMTMKERRLQTKALCGQYRPARGAPPAVEAHKELRVSMAVRAKLLRISPATTDRLLKPERDKLVGLDGGSTAGDYCFTLDITDVSSGWTGQAATQIQVFFAIGAVRDRLTIPVLGLDSDKGSEFINEQMKRLCEQEQITFTRSRPYRKNDTCYVEQKDWSVVRRFVKWM